MEKALSSVAGCLPSPAPRMGLRRLWGSVEGARASAQTQQRQRTEGPGLGNPGVLTPVNASSPSRDSPAGHPGHEQSLWVPLVRGCGLRERPVQLSTNRPRKGQSPPRSQPGGGAGTTSTHTGQGQLGPGPQPCPLFLPSRVRVQEEGCAGPGLTPGAVASGSPASPAGRNPGRWGPAHEYGGCPQSTGAGLQTASRGGCAGGKEP